MQRRVVRQSSSLGSQQRKHKPDYVLLLLAVGLLTVGLVLVYSIGPGLSIQKKVSENYYVGKQLIAILLGLIAFTVTANMPVTLWRQFERPLLYTAGAAAVAVRMFGEEVNGAYRWIQIGGLSFQAAELIKFALLIWLAGFLTERVRNNELQDFDKTFKPLLIALAIIGLVVAKVQSDLGSTGVMVAIIGTMIYVAGFPMKRLLTVGAVVLVATALLISSTAYRRERFATFLNPARDCQATGYQACQALIAIGSGGLFGLGLGRSVQAYGYLPEAANDSIFAIYAEKFGFLGTMLLLGLFAMFFARLKRIIERLPDMYSRLIIVGILAWLSTQSFINMGAMMGLLPLKGITLPFISYGGTSIIFISAAVGIAFQVSRYTTYGAIAAEEQVTTEGNAYEGNASGRRFRGAYRSGSGRS